jgi:hypothetical protein
MDRRALVAVVVFLAVVATVAAAAALTPHPAPTAGPLGPDQTYPDGAGPDHLDFSALAGNATLTHTPRAHWDSYAITHAAPPERRLVEGEYYIHSATGEIVADRWHGATVYRNGTTYAFRQPAEGLDDHRRDEFRSDPAFVYDDETDAYYRYDPHYGQIAPTTIGRHTTLVEPYTWTAVETTTHHGVPVITYRVTGTRPDARVPPPIDGTLQLGVDDGLVYAYEVTLDTDEGPANYTYRVGPAPFPDHGWVDRARALAGNATTARPDHAAG